MRRRRAHPSRQGCHFGLCKIAILGKKSIFPNFWIGENRFGQKKRGNGKQIVLWCFCYNHFQKKKNNGQILHLDIINECVLPCFFWPHFFAARTWQPLSLFPVLFLLQKKRLNLLATWNGRGDGGQKRKRGKNPLATPEFPHYLCTMFWITAFFLFLFFPENWVMHGTD